MVTSQSRFFINFRLIFFYNFQKESLENIIKTISRVYNVDVQYNAMDVKDVVFSGTIPKCEIKDAMNMITSASSFTYQMTDSIIRLKKK